MSEQTVLALLRERNRALAPALAATRAAESLLSDCALLETQRLEQQQRADLLEKERHMMAADIELLRQNEANSGVSREHVRPGGRRISLPYTSSELHRCQHTAPCPSPLARGVSRT